MSGRRTHLLPRSGGQAAVRHEPKKGKRSDDGASASDTERLALLLQAQLPARTSLGDLGLFLYELASLYELLRLAVDPAYEEYRFGKYPLYRGRRSLEPADRLAVDGICQGSPIELTGSVAVNGHTAGVVAAVVRRMAEELGLCYGFGQTDATWLEVLERQAQAERAPLLTSEEVTTRLDQRGARPHVDTVLRRLHRSPIRITRLQLRVERGGTIDIERNARV